MTQEIVDPERTEAEEQVLALLYGEPLRKAPAGLYIPPDALRVVLERFEGPLDLLLFLIRSQRFDVMDIPMAALTEQYMAYIALVRETNLELAAAYLVMAATLMQIKSRLLLPVRTESLDEEPEDPRAELMRRLLEYERIRNAARELDRLPRAGRDFRVAAGALRAFNREHPPEVTGGVIGSLWAELCRRQTFETNHTVERQELSVRERMSGVLERLARTGPFEFTELIATAPEGAQVESAVVWYLALLELAKAGLVALKQEEPYGRILVSEPPVLVEGEFADS